MSSERVVNSFKNYFKRAEMQDEFELEYAMYYSRSIKKKVAALADPDLHKLASKLQFSTTKT
jgi:hypothetical protein